ncbi:hypothetical protein BGZ83_001562 [Gryganskiella cystojenkinii]|nr:hypothetical protein BGZ83_001562 [Gryganskiella cystojenkinii]
MNGPSSLSRKPLEIDEIVAIVSTLVTARRDRIACLRVSKTFFSAFGRQVYKTIVLPENSYSRSKTVPLTTLIKYQSWVRSLILYDCFSIDYLDQLYLPQLSELRLCGIAQSYGAPDVRYFHGERNQDPTKFWFTDDLDGLPVQLIHRHAHTLEKLHLRNLRMKRSGPEKNPRPLGDNVLFWRTVLDLEHLRELCLNQVTVGEKDALAVFWKICEHGRLTKLELNSVWAIDLSKAPPEPYESLYSSSSMQLFSSSTLSEQQQPGQYQQDQQRCPSRLEKFSLEQFQCDLSATERFSKILRSSENLQSSVKMPGSNSSADLVLQTVPTGLEVFTFYGGLGLGDPGYQILLNRQAETLVHLDLARCFGVSSAMLHEILCTCPGLEYIGGDMISEMDITLEPAETMGEDKGEDVEGDDDLEKRRTKRRNDGAVQAREWVCKGLRHWHIPIYVNRRGSRMQTATAGTKPTTKLTPASNPMPTTKTMSTAATPGPSPGPSPDPVPSSASAQVSTPDESEPGSQDTKKKKKKKKASSTQNNNRPVATRSVNRISNPAYTLEANAQHWRQFQIFERLGQFKSLVMLNLTRSSGDSHGSLEMRLDRGLSGLRQVRTLEAIYLSDTQQEMRENDLEWLIKSLPRLGQLGGDLHPSRKKCVWYYQYLQTLIKEREKK